MAGLKFAFVLFISTACCLFASCTTGGKPPLQSSELTDEFRSFLAAQSQNAIRHNFEGYQFILQNGQLCIIGADNTEVWASKEDLYVDSFRIGDVNCDNIPDIAFVVWKSYRFGAKHPARMENDDASVRCHLFVYSIKDNKVKQLWCSSSLPRPIYSFEITTDGEQTPVKSGVRLVTLEGTYTEDYSKTEPNEYIYSWSGWGFSPEEAP